MRTIPKRPRKNWLPAKPSAGESATHRFFVKSYKRDRSGYFFFRTNDRDEAEKKFAEDSVNKRLGIIKMGEYRNGREFTIYENNR